MITGVRPIIYIYNRQAARVQAFLGQILGLASVEVMGGRSAGPPLQLTVHPTEAEPEHEHYLMCDDIQATIAKLAEHGVEVAHPVMDRGWGLLAQLRLPGGDEIRMYEPKHPSPIARPASGT